MNQSVILLSFILLSACSTNNKAIKEERKAWGFDNWKNEFKDRAVCLCLIEGYQNNEVKNFLLENDKSYYSAIGIDIFDPALEPVIREEVLKMKRDSSESLDRVAEGAAGKKVFYHCLHFYRSKRLDSIVKQEMPKWKKIKNIGEEVSKQVPAY